MLKTLRITSFVSIAAAAVAVLFVFLFGLRRDAAIEGLLSAPSVVEKLRKTSQSDVQKKDSVNPLMSEAKAFALRIDPPPPPPPPTPPPRPTEKAPQTAQDVVGPTRSFSGKFDLLGTVHYTTAPEKSLVLLDVVPDGQKWFRLGETVGRLTIHEVKEGSVVFYENNKFKSELFVPVTTSIRSLLKSDMQGQPASRGPSSLPGMPGISAENAVPAGQVLPVAAAPTQTQQPESAPASIRIQQPTAESPAVVPMPAAPEVEPMPAAPEPEPTPEERKASIEESITGIRQIMNENREGLSDADREEENKAWVDLLKVLEEEKKTLESGAQSEK